jgi:hypothetical protein
MKLVRIPPDQVRKTAQASSPRVVRVEADSCDYSCGHRDRLIVLLVDKEERGEYAFDLGKDTSVGEFIDCDSW